MSDDFRDAGADNVWFEATYTRWRGLSRQDGGAQPGLQPHFRASETPQCARRIPISIPLTFRNMPHWWDYRSRRSCRRRRGLSGASGASMLRDAATLMPRGLLVPI